MNKFELMPTEENLIKTLKDDLLKRNQDLLYFCSLLSSQETSCSIALDGKWGSGKTFFVKQSALFINANNTVNSMDGDKRRDILSSIIYSKDEECIVANDEIAVYYDAWENDNNTDPILSLVYAIAKEVGIEYNLNGNVDIYSLAGSILETISGRNISGIIDNLKCDNPLARIEEEKDLHKKIEEFFSEVLEERGNRLVVFIDELDRCKPSYAVQLLERIKHYLYDDRITFVFAVNLEELQHTIRHYYGDTFDACRYLDRFFDIRISLPVAEKTLFYNRIGLDSAYIVESVCRKVIEVYNMELREITRFYQQVKTAVYEPTHESKRWNFDTPSGKGRLLMLIYIVPLLIGLKIVDISLHDEFINGKNPKPLMDMYKDSELGVHLFERLLNKSQYNEDVAKSDMSIEKKLQELYEAIFTTEYTNGTFYKEMGNYMFDKDSKNFVINVASILSKYADYH